MKLFVTDTSDKFPDKKCGSCNWHTETFYGIGDSVEDAKSNYEEDEDYGRGMCAQCMCELMIEEGLNIQTR